MSKKMKLIIAVIMMIIGIVLMIIGYNLEMNQKSNSSTKINNKIIVEKDFKKGLGLKNIFSKFDEGAKYFDDFDGYKMYYQYSGNYKEKVQKFNLCYQYLKNNKTEKVCVDLEYNTSKNYVIYYSPEEHLTGSYDNSEYIFTKSMLLTSFIYSVGEAYNYSDDDMKNFLNNISNYTYEKEGIELRGEDYSHLSEVDDSKGINTTYLKINMKDGFGNLIPTTT